MTRAMKMRVRSEGGNTPSKSQVPLLNINNLSISFEGTNTVVKGTSLTLHRGEMLALVGESGSGKTLTALSTLKLTPPEATLSGEITLDGQPILGQPESAVAKLRGSKVGVIFQEPMTSLNPLHPIDRQMIESYLWHHGKAGAAARLAALYDEVGLSHLKDRGKLYPHQLSGGERQRVMIGMAMACNPDLLIADEPTTALDVTLQRQILLLLKKLQHERQMGILLITHDLTTVRKVADRVAVMQHGEIVETGDVETIFTAPQHPYTKQLLAAFPKGHAAPLLPTAEKILESTLSVHFPIRTGLLRRTTGMVKAVEQVPLTLHAGETIGIVGESGSGKSSMGYGILRLIDSAGPITFLGRNLRTLDRQSLRAERAHMQLVFQDPFGSLNPRMTVGDIIAEGLTIHRPELSLADMAGQVAEMLSQVGLTPDMATRYPHAFSGGQRQRIAIARAMILKPKLMVLDEPTSALDMSIQGQVLELLRKLQQEYGTSYLFISHDLRVIRAVAHQVIVLKKGEVVEHGPTASLFANPQHPYTQSLMHAAFGDTL